MNGCVPERGRGEGGFTLVEVLLALALCVALAGTVAATASVCRRAEASGDAAEQVAAMVSTIYAHRLLGRPLPESHDWMIEMEPGDKWRLTTNLTVRIEATLARPLVSGLPPIELETLSP